jgi:hypothetical protein
VEYRDKRSGAMGNRTVAEGLGITGGPSRFVVMRDHLSGREHLVRSDELIHSGVRVHLHAYERRVWLDVREVADDTGVLETLHARIGDGGVKSIELALDELRSEPLREAFAELIGALTLGEAGSGTEPAFAGFLRTAEEAGLALPKSFRESAERSAARVRLVAEGISAEQEPVLDPAWPVAWAVWRETGGSASGIQLDLLDLEGRERWGLLVPVLERHVDEIVAWAQARSRIAPLRVLLARLVEEPDVESALHVHDHEGVAWFDRDGFRTLGRAAATAALLGSPRAGRRRVDEVLKAFHRLEERSGYRLERLLEEPQKR